MDISVSMLGILIVFPPITKVVVLTKSASTLTTSMFLALTVWLTVEVSVEVTLAVTVDVSVAVTLAVTVDVSVLVTVDVSTAVAVTVALTWALPPENEEMLGRLGIVFGENYTDSP